MKSILLLFLSLFLLASCEKGENDIPASKSNVLLRIGAIGTGSSVLADSHQFSDLSGYLFVEGVLTEIYPELSVAEGGFVEGMTIAGNPGAHLYLLGNTSNVLDVGGFIKGTLKEADFKKTVITAVALPDNGVYPVMTAWTELKGQTVSTPVELMMVRAFARLDIEPESGVLIEEVALANAAHSAYLLAQEPVNTPEGSKRGRLLKKYSTPLDQKEEGLFFLYEQVTKESVVTITATIEGVKNVLTVALPDVIKRNLVYNIKVTTVGANLQATVQELPWGTGETVEGTPDLAKKVRIDASRSEFPEGFRVSDTKDTLYIPHTGGNFRLALDASSEIEVVVYGDESRISLSPLTNSDNGLSGTLWQANIPAKGLAIPQEFIQLRIRNKNLSNFYDQVVLSIDESETLVYVPTVVLGGKEWMSFNSYGEGTPIQKTITSWEEVEDFYSGNEWTESLGMLFQWGRKYPHNQYTSYPNNPGGQTNQITDWNGTPDGIPCPAGYKIPTRQEILDLFPPDMNFPTDGVYEYGGEQIRATLHSATPATVTNWNGYSGQTRYLKLTSQETGNYLIFPLGGGKVNKQSSSDPGLGKGFRMWATEGPESAKSDYAGDFYYWPNTGSVAKMGFDGPRKKEAYAYVRCIKKD